jgi:uncharacterized membrane protein YkvA (DUF1232 family)
MATRAKLLTPHHVIPRELTPTGFYRTRERARDYLNDQGKASRLLTKAISKAASSKASLGEAWEGLLILFRLLRNWITGDYRDVGIDTMLLVMAATLYFVMPIDAVPDFIPALGFIDDVAFILFVLNCVRAELDKFAGWEKTNRTGQ